MRPVAVGVQLPEVERPVGWPELREIATTAEAVGLDSIWVGDHLLYRDDHGTRGPWEAWTLLAALGEATERVTIGPLVAATAFHNPGMLAKQAATVDEVSGGRLVLGLGAGWNRVEFDAFGFPYDHRASRFSEAFTIIHSLVREGAVDFEGRFHVARDLELVPAARPDLPLMIGSIGSRVLAATLPHVDLWNGWHDWFDNDPDRLSEMVADVAGACRSVGRDPAQVGMTAAVAVRAPGGSGRLAGGRGRPPTASLDGSPDAVAERLAAFGAAGVQHLQVVLDPIDAASVEWLGDVVARLGPLG
jgi:alkanesulfonate monooxygenase SsuD/methylene tetrahydromethanopterin reductase-like flavin-dependent oxidoreductase (luciferase family)